MPLNPAELAYDAAVLSILQSAYDEACRDIGLDPHPIDHSSTKGIREALASEIMNMASMGLRDPRLLRERALRAVIKPAVSLGAGGRARREVGR